MASAPTAVIVGVGGALPETVVTNEQLTHTLDTSDAWIRDRTGISERRRAAPHLGTGDLAAAAGRAALESAGAASADTLLLATTPPDMRCPATAPHVAERLGLAPAAACDISAVCSGFVYALAMATGLVRGGMASSVLVVAAETYSRIVDPHDRGTAVLFGDGAGAVLVAAGEATQPGAVVAADLGSDGRGRGLISVPDGGALTPDGPDRYFRMSGAEVFAHAVRRMTSSSRAVLKDAGWAATDLEAFIAHQANRRILDLVADRLGVPARSRISNIAGVGNTAAASIPIAMAEALQQHHRPGGRTVLTAFGGGLAWGSVAMTWPSAKAVTTTVETSEEP